ncbi:hypothetical protein DYB26_002482 [Aphanomyces astaci]|uniref:Uncharacterized protein n=1 Tax=Aphanomyces astaci TaxID=112090 RepID=A0A418DHJ4_APHAT|nr:hypothetical protein DYB26_002482 [Aphanomyces astaci]
MRALYPPTAVTPLTNPRLLPAPVVAVSPQPPPTTVPVEYESSSGTLVLHEPIRSRRGSLKPRLHPICVQARANMVRRLEQLHIPEQYQPGDSTTLVRKPFGHHNAATVTKEKPMGRLLRPLDKQKDPHIIHAEREFACGSSSPSNLYDSSLTLKQSTPNIPQPTGHHRPLPPVNKPHIRIDQLSVQQHTTALGPVISPTSMPPLLNPLQRQCTVPSPQSPA